MKAKSLDLETCEGVFTLANVVYHFISNDLVEIHFSSSIFDRDLEKVNAIIKTQLMTNRTFIKSETESGYDLVFDYPFTLICGMIA